MSRWTDDTGQKYGIYAEISAGAATLAFEEKTGEKVNQESKNDKIPGLSLPPEAEYTACDK